MILRSAMRGQLRLSSSHPGWDDAVCLDAGGGAGDRRCSRAGATVVCDPRRRAVKKLDALRQPFGGRTSGKGVGAGIARFLSLDVA